MLRVYCIELCLEIMKKEELNLRIWFAQDSGWYSVQVWSSITYSVSSLQSATGMIYVNQASCKSKKQKGVYQV